MAFNRVICIHKPTGIVFIFFRLNRPLKYQTKSHCIRFPLIRFPIESNDYLLLSLSAVLLMNHPGWEYNNSNCFVRAAHGNAIYRKLFIHVYYTLLIISLLALRLEWCSVERVFGMFDSRFTFCTKLKSNEKQNE